MPAVWLAWSMLLFVVTILSFVWRTGSVNDPDPWPGLSPAGALGPRIAVSAVFMMGLGYFVLIVRTLQSYSGPRFRGSYRGPGSAGGMGSPVPGGGNTTGAGTAGSSSGRGDGERRGRERERGTKGRRSDREREKDRQRMRDLEQERNQEREREREYEGDGKKDDYGKEKGPSGLRKGWGLGLTGEIEDSDLNDAGVGTSEEATLEREKVEVDER